MKPTFLFLLVLCISILVISSCKKDKQEKLPEETQTGAGTFGCLVDGEVFIPGGAQMSGGSLNCNYQLIDGRYYYRLVGRNDNDKNNRKSVGVFLHNSILVDDSKYLLGERFKDSIGYSTYINILSSPSEYLGHETNSLHQGELFIKHFDSVQQIVSGTFWFDAISENGEIVQIREGRFDVRYTR
jgi:hypothetical protein